MKRLDTKFLLATSAIAGVLVAAPAFAQIEDVADPGVALVTTPIVNATDGNKNLLLTTVTETVQVTEGTVALGTGTGSAIQADNAGGATTFTLDNTGSAVESTVTIKGTVDKQAAQDLNFDITGAANQIFRVNAKKAINLGAGDLTLTGSTTTTTLTADGNITAANLTSDGTAGGTTTAILNGTTTLSAGMALTSANGNVTNNGTLTVGTTLSGAGTFTNTGTATVTGDVTSTGTIANSGTLNLDGANNAATINNAGTLSIGQPLTNAGTIDLASSGSTIIDATDLANGDTAITGGTLALTGSTKVLLDAALVNTDVVTLTNLDSIDAAVAAGRLTGAHALNQVTVDETVGGVTLTVGAANNASQTATALGVSTLEGAKLLSAGTDAIAGNFTAAGAAFTPTETAITNALNGTNSASAAQQLGDANASAGATAAATVGASNSAGSKIDNRLASLRNGQSMAAGNMLMDKNVWFEASATDIDQDAREGAAGFQVQSFGGTIGMDGEVAENKRVGVAFTYNYADVDGDGAANSSNEISTYLLSLYADHKYDNDVFVTTTGHFGVNDIDVAQNVLGFGRMEGDYTTEQYGASVEAGRTFMSGETRIVPTAGLSYTHVGGDTVTLRQAGNAVQDDISSKDLLIGKVGVRFEGDYAQESGATVSPSAHVNYLYDFIGDEITSTRSFGGVLVGDQEADIARGTLNVGLAMTFESADKSRTFKIGYDAAMKDEYLGHTASAKVTFKF